MNAHRHLHSPASNSNLSTASREDYSGGSGATNSIASSSITSASHSNSHRPRRRLLATIHRLVRPNSGGLTGKASSSAMPRSGSATAAAAASFRIVHERDDTPAYTPARPTVPRTNSECQAALEEMFARAKGEGDEDDDDEDLGDLEEERLEGLWEEPPRVEMEGGGRAEHAATAAKTVLGRAEQQRRHDHRRLLPPPTPPPLLPPPPPPSPSPSPRSHSRDGIAGPPRPAPAAPGTLQIPSAWHHGYIPPTTRGPGGVRLEPIPASPHTPADGATAASVRSMPEPTRSTEALRFADFLVTPSTPVAAGGGAANNARMAFAGGSTRGEVRVISGEGLTLRAPRPLSERAMIPLDGLRTRQVRLRQGIDHHQHHEHQHQYQRQAQAQAQSSLSPLGPGPLTSSGSSPTTRREREEGPPILSSPLRLSPLRASPMVSSTRSPLARPAVIIDSTRGSSSTGTKKHHHQRQTTIKPPPQMPTITWPRKGSRSSSVDGDDDAERRGSRPHMSITSMRAHDGEETDSGDEFVIGPGVPSPRMILEFQNRLDDEEVASTNGMSMPNRTRYCYLCPLPCEPGMTLCSDCYRRFRLPEGGSDHASSAGEDSDYEDFDVRTPSLSLSPRKSKALSFSIPISPSTPINHGHSRSRSDTVSPRTPETPRGWSRVSTPLQYQHQHQHTDERQTSGKPLVGTSSIPNVVKQLKMFPSPPPRKISIASSPTSARKHSRQHSHSYQRPNHDSNDDEHEDKRDEDSRPQETGTHGGRGSALYHLERRMKLENWRPLAPGAATSVAATWRDHDVVRVGSVSSPRVVVRNSDAENADTMKMLADESLVGEEDDDEFDALASPYPSFPCRPGQPQERMHEAGGSYGDWFSYYAEREGARRDHANHANHETVAYPPRRVDDGEAFGHLRPSSVSPASPSLSYGLFCSLLNRERESSDPNTYDRVLSIYDTYADDVSANEEEVDMV